MHAHAIGRNRVLLGAALFAGLVAAFFATQSRSSPAGPGARVVSTAKNATLGKTVLVTMKGLTLYSLSVERKGKFICTKATCLSVWKPLLVAKGTTPTGVSGLGTIARPGSTGRVQVTFHSAPLYTFYLDRKRGDAKGEGLKDAGVWHAASTAGAASTAPAATAETTTTSSGGGGYGDDYGG